MRAALILFVVAACSTPDPVPPTPADPVEAPPPSVPDPAATMPITLRAKFVWAETDPLHAVSPATLDDDGPFVGNDLGPEDYEVLDEQLLAMVGYEGLYACFEVGDGLFLLRGPGADAPTDLFLAEWESGPRLLTWVADLAFDQCGVDGCNRMQSWLTDLDGDGRRDVVSRSWREDLETGAVEEELEAWLVGPDGALNPTRLPASERARYRPN